MKTLKTFSNVAEAGFAGSLLEAAGIPVLLADEQSSLWSYGMAIPIRLQVEEADVDRALEILEKGLRAADEAPPSAATALESTSGDCRLPVWLFLAAGAVFALMVFLVRHTAKDRKPRASREQTYEFDQNGDGRADSFATYRGDCIISSKGDRNFDGRIDEWLFFDEQGRTTRAERDDNFDGQPDAWVTYRGGVETSAKRDTDFNGKVDSITTYTHAVPVRTEVRPNESKVMSRLFLYRSGVLYEQRVDQDQDGKFDYRILYDPFSGPSERMPLAESK